MKLMSIVRCQCCGDEMWMSHYAIHCAEKHPNFQRDWASTPGSKPEPKPEPTILVDQEDDGDSD